MHTREQALTRLQEIAEYVKGIDEKIMNLDSWLSAVGRDGEPPRECGTICCVMGWMGIENKFGVTIEDDDTPYINAIDESGNYRIYGFSAAMEVIFGGNFRDSSNSSYELAHNIVRTLFGPVHFGRDSVVFGMKFDESDERIRELQKISHKEIFLKRAEYAVKMINALYDGVEAVQSTA